MTKWERSASVWPEEAATFNEDWTGVDVEGRRLGRIYRAGREDGFESGNWRWRIRPDGTGHGGSAENGSEAKRIIEELA